MTYNIGRGGSGTKVISDIESEALWGQIKVYHDKANYLMDKDSLLQRNIEKLITLLGTKKNKDTQVYKKLLKKINRFQDDHRKYSAEITLVLRKKDILLKKVKK